jgi:hypothetical protein
VDRPGNHGGPGIGRECGDRRHRRRRLRRRPRGLGVFSGGQSAFRQGRGVLRRGRRAQPPPRRGRSSPPSRTGASGWRSRRSADVTDDGVCDIGVGAPAEAGTGRAYVFKGLPGRSRPTLPWIYLGAQTGANFGAAIRGGGDVDGDGIGDFVIGEPNYDGGQTDEGRLHLVYGNPTKPLVAWMFESDVAFQGLGASLATLSDVSNDGFADIAAGAPANPSVVGRTYLFAGGGGVGVWRSLPLQKDLSSSPYNYHPMRIGSAQSAGVLFPLRSAEGRARIQLQLEVMPLNQPFKGQPTQTMGPLDTGDIITTGSVLPVLSTLNLPWMGVTYKVRGRSRSASPFFPGSRWIRP